MGGPRTLLRILAIASLAVLVVVLAYAALTAGNGDQVGASLVNSEFPPPSISPIFFKPVTYLYVSALIFMYAGLELAKDTVGRLPPTVRTLIRFLAFLLAVTFLYEVFYNFTFWGAQIAGNLNPDQIGNPFPLSTHRPWNLVFTTKVFTMLMLVGAYCYYYMTQLESRKK